LPDKLAHAAYAKAVLLAMAASVRFDRPEHLLVNSFWTGFGWLDLISLAWLAGGLHVLSWLALVLSLWRTWRAGEARRLAWLLCFGVGLTLSLAAYALALASMERNLHGRYVVGWYLVTLSLAWSWLAWDDGAAASKWRRAGVGARRLLPLLALAGHASSLVAILRRYF